MEEKLKQILRKLTTTEKQIYSAKCLEAFCNYFKIKDKNIDELLTYLFAINVFDNLATWEKMGRKLNMNGRGDLLPAVLLEKVPPEKIFLFTHLVDSCVEVGLVDIYGAQTNMPFEYLLKCVEILKKESIPLPVV